MRFVGIDLAWGAKNTTGAVTLKLDAPEGLQTRLVVDDWADALLTDEDILNFVRRSDTGTGIVLGIDAPLDVPNLTGERPVEAMLRRCFGKYQAGAHPANRTRFRNDVRGERLAARLAVGAKHSQRLRFCSRGPKCAAVSGSVSAPRPCGSVPIVAHPEIQGEDWPRHNFAHGSVCKSGRRD